MNEYKEKGLGMIANTKIEYVDIGAFNGLVPSVSLLDEKHRLCVQKTFDSYPELLGFIQGFLAFKDVKIYIV